MWNKILTAIGVKLVEKLAALLWSIYEDWKQDRAMKRDINAKVKELKQAHKPDEIRKAIRNLNL